MKFYRKIEYKKDLDIKSLLSSYKVVHVLKGNIDDLFWEKEAKKIGDLVSMDEDKSTGNKNGNFWIDIKYDVRYPNLYLHSNTRQPFHTDGAYESNPPDISFFFCKVRADIGGSTTFLDLKILKKCMEIECPVLLKQISSSLFSFKKGDDSKIVKIMDDGKMSWNFHRVEKSKITKDFYLFLERINDMGLVKRVLLNRGDAVFFRDNMVLHGRDAFIGERWLRKGGINIRRKSDQ